MRLCVCVRREIGLVTRTFQRYQVKQEMRNFDLPFPGNPFESKSRSRARVCVYVHAWVGTKRGGASGEEIRGNSPNRFSSPSFPHGSRTAPGAVGPSGREIVRPLRRGSSPRSIGLVCSRSATDRHRFLHSIMNLAFMLMGTIVRDCDLCKLHGPYKTRLLLAWQLSIKLKIFHSDSQLT